MSGLSDNVLQAWAKTGEKNLIKAISQDTACNSMEKESCLARLLQNLLVSRWLSNKAGSKQKRNKCFILNLFFSADALSPLLHIYGVPTIGETPRWRETPPSLLFWSWPWSVFSLTVKHNMPSLEKCQDSKCLSGTVYYNLSKSSESVSAPLWEVSDSWMKSIKI